jgi:cell division protein FtsB
MSQGRIISSKTLSAMRKDVTGYLYGGDVSRKNKLLQKQKKGKKHRAQFDKNRVQIPEDVFMKMVQSSADNRTTRFNLVVRYTRCMRAKQLKQGVIVGSSPLINFWFASLIWGLAEKTHVAVSKAHEAQSQYEELEERKHMLEANLAALGTDLGKDAAIRTAFGVARPGEEVIVVVRQGCLFDTRANLVAKGN